MQKNKWFNKKKTAGILAVVLVAAIALSGTFAFMQNGPHRSSYLSTKGTGIFQLNMSNNFNEYKKETWNAAETISAPFFVNSLSYLPEFTEDAYVAVNVMEYIHTKTASDWVLVQEVLGTGTDTSKALFAIDNMGAYMTYAATVAKLGAANVVNYEPTAGVTYGMINGSQTAAQNNAFNGIHGTPMRKPGHEFTYGDVAAMDYVKAHGAENPTTDECTADPIQSWTAADAGIAPTEEARDYVSFGMTNFITLADWQAKYAADVNDPTLHGDFWILNPNGWAYYAKALPVGAKTANLIDGLTLNETVDEITFYMHYDMIASDITEIDRLGETVQAGLGTFSVGTPTGIKMPGMPAELINSFKNKVVVATITIGGEDYKKGADDKWRDEDGNVVPSAEDKDGNVYIKTGDDEWTCQETPVPVLPATPGEVIDQLEMNKRIVAAIQKDIAAGKYTDAGAKAEAQRAIAAYESAIALREANSTDLTKIVLLEASGGNSLVAAKGIQKQQNMTDTTTVEYAKASGIASYTASLAATQLDAANNMTSASKYYYEEAIRYQAKSLASMEIYYSGLELNTTTSFQYILDNRCSTLYKALAVSADSAVSDKAARSAFLESAIPYIALAEENFAIEKDTLLNKASFYMNLIARIGANPGTYASFSMSDDNLEAYHLESSGTYVGKYTLLVAVVPDGGTYTIKEQYKGVDIVRLNGNFMLQTEALKVLNVSSNLQYLNGFAKAVNLTAINFPSDSKLTTFDGFNYNGLTYLAPRGLTEIVLPKTVTTIGSSALVGFHSGLTVRYPSTLTVSQAIKDASNATWTAYTPS